MGHRVVVKGVRQLEAALAKIAARAKDVRPVTEELAGGMHKYVPVVTGYLKSTIYYKRNVAGASAPYAGYVAEMGGSRDYPQRAMDAFDFDKYADHVVEPF